MNPWAILQYAHNMCATVVTASFVMAAVGAFYMLEGRFVEYAQIFLRTAVTAGFIACILMIFPTGDAQGKYAAKHQPVTVAGMEGALPHPEPVQAWSSSASPTRSPRPSTILSSSTTSSASSSTAPPRQRSRDSIQFPRDQWPQPLPLLFYAYHIMVGLGTYFLAVMSLAVFMLGEGSSSPHPGFSGRSCSASRCHTSPPPPDG